MLGTWTTWDIVKQQAQSGVAKLTYTPDGDDFIVYSINGPIQHQTYLRAGTPELADFDANFRPLASTPSDPLAVAPAPFDSKVLPDGGRLFKRKHGVPSAAVPAGSSLTTLFTVPYAACKINEVEVLGCRQGDQVDFSILDTDTGAVSGFPSAPLNQFGFGVYLADGIYRETSRYDADLFAGLQLSMTYINNGPDAVTPAFNVLLHEVK